MNVNTYRITVTISAITAFVVIAAACIALGGPPEVVSIAGDVLIRMMGVALRQPPGRD
ncbi:hypothetical protein QRB41_12970 [Mycobacterium avium subsp. hominissuis]|uniref:hypothetical protein n=1 Tax=Mycobacteriaceae TaxID=1762 RepID=UPI001595AD4A|nr:MULTISPECIES: hypothetical protein [Mycobacteriaceae]MDO2384310.1 hypothetical protein [Mycobacterium avium subsp. hominissuis]MDO2395318.1 hypothetical protein [Mycobacterium avium subsp. hominissuis]